MEFGDLFRLLAVGKMCFKTLFQSFLLGGIRVLNQSSSVSSFSVRRNLGRVTSEEVEEMELSPTVRPLVSPTFLRNRLIATFSTKFFFIR